MFRFRSAAGLALLFLLLLNAPAPAPVATAAAEVFVLDVRGDQALVLRLPERQLALRSPGQLADLGLIALSARFLPDGSVVAVDADFALWRIDDQGRHAWLPAGSANAPLFLSPGGLRLAYLKPLDLPPGDDTPLTNAVAVLDLQTNAETVLFSLPGTTPRLYGWAGDRLLLEVPTWQPATAAAPARPADQLILATLATDAPGLPQALAALPPLAAGSRYPQTSFDQRYLAYTIAVGAVIGGLAAWPYAVYAGRADPLWSETGLTVLQAETRRPLPWAAADLAPAPALTGPAALPAVTPLADFEITGPTAPGSVFLYRPVKASTRVSAYYDLNRTVGAISDWLGVVGAAWIYGRAYDQHSGTDYDGVTGDAVYASAPGHILAIHLDCANTYPNGPGSFGSYVMINHGAQGDGASYRTLVGHLKCDGYFITEGVDVNSLPLQIGQMGNTGWSTGDHTHLQVYRNNAAIDPYDWHIISDTPPTVPVSTIGDLQGTVRDWNGQLAAGVTVKLFNNGAYRVAITGGDGHYLLAELHVGAAGLTAVQGARWGQLAATVVGGQLVTAPDLLLNQCAGTTSGADGCPVRTFDGAAYVADVTVPDESVWPLNQPLDKTWRLLNTGATVWGDGYALVFVGGDQRGSPLAIPVPPTGPGAQVDLSTTLTTPADYGQWRGYWRLRSPEGVYFGPLIWVQLNTAPGAVASVDAGPSVSPPAADGAKPDPYAAAPAGLAPAAAPSCTVAGLPSVTAGPTVTVNWSGGDGTGALNYEIQYRDSGRGLWRLWLGGVAATSGSFAGQLGHTYAFRCRATDATTAAGAYPGSGDTRTLLGHQTGQPDLHLADLSVAPNPAGGLWARLTIQNEGSADTQRGFYADLYLNHSPTGPGDVTGSVQLWVNEPLAAGATRTLEAQVLQASGQGNVTLYAQVDSSGVIAESDEDDNRQTTGVTQCLAAEDVYEDDNWPAQAPAYPLGVSQARTLGGPGDQDWVFMGLQADHLYAAATSNLSPGVDTRLRLISSDGASVVTSNDDQSATSLASQFRFVPPNTGAYYLAVSDWNPATGGCSAAYTLTLTDLGPGFRLILPLILR